MIRSTLVRLAGLLIAMAGVPPVQPSLAAGPEAAETRSIEARLRDLEYPELRRRSAQEIAVYKTLVDATEKTYQHVAELHGQGARGGGTVEFAQAGHRAALAKAGLAWAEGRVADAYVHTRRAVEFADQLVLAVEKAWEAGVITLDLLSDAQVGRAEISLRLIRAEKVAKMAGVDLTPVKRREDQRRKQAKPAPDDEVLPPSVAPPPVPIPGRG